MEYSVEAVLVVSKEEIESIVKVDVENDNQHEAYTIAITKWHEVYGEDVVIPEESKCRITKSSEIIVQDSDSGMTEDVVTVSGGLYPYDPVDKSIDIDEIPYSIFEYIRQLKKDKIIIQPEFQRNQIWTVKQKSQFIESIILNFPLPPIYLNETKEGKYLVIDGLQRTTTLCSFMDDGFALTSLEAIPSYNGYKFSDLSDVLKSKIEDKKIVIFSLKPSTPSVVIYDLFKRINTGGTQLNRQEIRNCIYIGKSTRLLKSLSESAEFKRAIDWGVSSKRMKDREVVLRYIAFRWQDIENEYTGDMSGFVEGMMRKINLMDDIDIEKITLDFIETMQKAYIVLGQDGFRIRTQHTRGVVNIALFESICLALSKNSISDTENKRDIIKENYQALLNDSTYISASTSSTSSKNNVLTRFQIANEIINGGL